MFKYYQIRYFNEQTGYGGASYKKKTAKPMCEELKNMKYMTAYVEEMSGTSACAVFQDGNPGCSEKELKYINKNLANDKEENEKKLQEKKLQRIFLAPWEMTGNERKKEKN